MKRSDLKKIIRESFKGILIEEEEKRDEMGRQTGIGTHEIEYTNKKKEQISKLIVNLSGTTSGRYSKIIDELIEIESQLEKLKERDDDLKVRARDEIKKIFGAENAIHTRVVRTVGAYQLVLSKTSGTRVTVDAKEVKKDLEQMLTDHGLLDAYLAILKKHEKVSEAPEPGVRVTKIAEGGSAFGWIEKLKRWLSNYDAKFAEIEKRIKSL